MNTAEQVLLYLIQESLFGVTTTYPDDVDWNAVFQEAQDQAVFGLINQIQIKNLFPQWQSKRYQILSNCLQNLYAQQELIQLLTEHNIPMAILKGAASAVYYPYPFYRTMGDIDVIVPPDYFNAAAKIMENNGYVKKTFADEDYERHDEYYKNGMEIELHHFF